MNVTEEAVMFLKMNVTEEAVMFLKLNASSEDRADTIKMLEQKLVIEKGELRLLLISGKKKRLIAVVQKEIARLNKAIDDLKE